MFFVKSETAIAQLAIADGAWQESPDTVAQFDETALFGSEIGRGNLFVVVEVAGDAAGRDEIAREIVETTRREYAASRGSITLALTQAARAANDAFYYINVGLAPELRRIAGMTAAILREDELFIAQAGPGLTCVQRGNELRRYPDISQWFNADETALAEWLAARNFPTPGAVPMGMRRDYAPDVFHVALQPGDAVVLSTRALAHVLSNQELLDTVAQRHPDEIVASLEDLAGAADLAVIVIRLAGENLAPAPLRPDSYLEALAESSAPAIEPELPVEEPVYQLPPIPAYLSEESPQAPALAVEPPVEEEPLPEPKPHRERRSIDLAPARNALLRGTAGVMGLLAGIFGRINWSSLGKAIDGAISAVLRLVARALVFLINAIMPGTPKESAASRAPTSPRAQTAWQLAALVFPIMLIIAGGATWANYRADQQRIQAAQLARLVQDANKAIEDAKNVGRNDKNAARELLQKAIDFTEQTKKLDPTYPPARKAYYDATDELDKLNGVLVLFPTMFATLPDAKANITRVLFRSSDVFVLDRGGQRVYRYAVNDAGLTTATPTPTDNAILKAGDKVENRTVGELIDMTWIEAGRLVVIDRTGAFWQFEPARSAWSVRVATDAAQWKNVNLLASYTGNLYLSDPARNQILKYVAASEGVWTAAVTYFAPETRADLSNVTDLAIDSDVWLLRGDGSIFRYTAGKPNDLKLRDLEVPLSKPTMLVTAQPMAAMYIADAGNQRIVQIDKVSGKFVRQFKPTSQLRESFQLLKALAVDEPNRKFFWVSGNTVYLATIPQ